MGNLSSAAVASIIGIAIAIVIIVVVARRYARPRSIDVPDMMNDQAFVCWLHEYEQWYTKSSKRYHRTVYWCRPAPIVIGFLVAIVSALDDKAQFFMDWVPKNIVVIFLTGLAALCVAILTQLGVIDLSRAREIGRINQAALFARVAGNIPATPNAAPNRFPRVSTADGVTNGSSIMPALGPFSTHICR